MAGYRKNAESNAYLWVLKGGLHREGYIKTRHHAADQMNFPNRSSAPWTGICRSRFICDMLSFKNTFASFSVNDLDQATDFYVANSTTFIQLSQVEDFTLVRYPQVGMGLYRQSWPCLDSEVAWMIRPDPTVDSTRMRHGYRHRHRSRSPTPQVVRSSTRLSSDWINISLTAAVAPRVLTIAAWEPCR